MAAKKINWGVVSIMATVVLAAVAATHVIDGDIAVVQHSVSLLSERVTKVEGATKVLGNQQSDEIKQLVRDLLAAASNALPTKPESAKKALDSVGSLLAVMKKRQVPGDASYFRDTVSVIDVLAKKTGQDQATDIKSSLFDVRLQLAEYRSSVETVPVIPTAFEKLEIAPGRPFTPDLLQARGAYLISSTITTYPGLRLLSEGAVINASPISSGDILQLSFVPPPGGKPLSEQLASTVEGLIFVGASQTLDNGISWKNVVFYNVHIKYKGRTLRLDNVHFVNCTFDVLPTDRGANFVDYAALQTGELTIS